MCPPHTSICAAPFNTGGWHDMRLLLLDAAHRPLSGFVELQYFVAENAGGEQAGGGERGGEGGDGGGGEGGGGVG